MRRSGTLAGPEAGPGARLGLAWPHAAPGDVVLGAVDSTPEGLSPDDAAERVRHFGPNALPEPVTPGFVAHLLRQFASPLIYILIFAAALSAYLREWADTGFIAAVLVINAVVGAVQEYQAARSAAALRRMVPAHARVLRDGEVYDVDTAELVPGDVALVAPGDRVPADMRLLEAAGLQVDESALTGESVAVTKDPTAALDPDTPLAERVTMCYAGTLVARGRGRGVLVATGTQTELGQLGAAAGEPSAAEPPLLRRMRQFTVTVAAVIGVMAVIIGGISLARGVAPHEVALTAVALAVSAIPEGLPVALTVALAIGMNRMARRNVVVRRLVAVESLGSCTVIASDKTGTLTLNELTVTRVALPQGEEIPVSGVGTVPEGRLLVSDHDDVGRRIQAERLAEAAALCTEATLARHDDGWVHTGDPVDVALLVLAHKLGFVYADLQSAWETVAELPFEPERRYAATTLVPVTVPGAHESAPGGARLVVKGATEAVVPMCTRQSSASGPDVPLDPAQSERAARRLAAAGHRVLAVAAAEGPLDDLGTLEHGEIGGLTLLGFLGMVDPLRPSARGAVQACHSAGVAVDMVTGDHPDTALAIAGELDLAHSEDEVVTGGQLRAAERQGDRAVDVLTARARVFARVEPAQKLTIVESLARQGEIVAVTGDGANDAPALRHAHVGVAMGAGGTDAAREAADLLIVDDDFSSIEAGIEEGRVAYGNVRKVVLLLVATGAAELLLVLLAVGLELPLPLGAIQLLWLNLVTNGIQDVALAFEPGEGDEMRRPPRPPDEPIFNRIMIERVVLAALVMAGVTFATYRWVLASGAGVVTARNVVLLLMVLFENVFVFAVRSERHGIRHQFTRNRFLVAGTLVAQGVHILAMQFGPTQRLLGVAPVSVTQWLALLGLALTLLVAVEAHKAWVRRRERRHGVRGAHVPG